MKGYGKMEDIVEIIIKYLREKYHSPNPALVMGYNMKFTSRIMFTIPEYNALMEFSALELIKVYELVGKEETLKVLDRGIAKMIEDYRKRFPDGCN